MLVRRPRILATNLNVTDIFATGFSAPEHKAPLSEALGLARSHLVRIRYHDESLSVDSTKI